MGSRRVGHDWGTKQQQYILLTQSISVGVQLLSWRSMDRSTPGFPVLHFPEFAQTHVHWVDDAIQPSHLLLPIYPLPSILLSIRVFSSEFALCIRWPKCWSFNFSISLSNEYSGVISFRIDWFDLLAVQGTLKSLLQHPQFKGTHIIPCSAFFIVQLSHPYVTTGKTIALTTQTFIGKVMSLLFNILSRFVIAFLPRSKYNWVTFTVI